MYVVKDGKLWSGISEKETESSKGIQRKEGKYMALVLFSFRLILYFFNTCVSSVLIVFCMWSVSQYSTADALLRTREDMNHRLMLVDAHLGDWSWYGGYFVQSFMTPLSTFPFLISNVWYFVKMKNIWISAMYSMYAVITKRGNQLLIWLHSCLLCFVYLI